MKVRVKFSKTGAMKFVGHLDIMRYFQKAIRRADIDITFSGGYSPHMVMSFAAPLGVGVESHGEYFDMELNRADSSSNMMKRLNQTMADGMEILGIIQVPDEKASKAMSLVSASDYSLAFRRGYEPCENWQTLFEEYLEQPQILIVKKTKKSEQELDIRPLVYKYRIEEDGSIFMQTAAGSVMNLKPDLVMEGFFRYLDLEWNPLSIQVTRLEVYADTEEGRMPLMALGEIIE